MSKVSKRQLDDLIDWYSRDGTKRGQLTLEALEELRQEGEPVAYLDLGAGGYMDVGTDLSDEQLSALPKGRHMLGIIGTYGVDGYMSATQQELKPNAAATINRIGLMKD